MDKILIPKLATSFGNAQQVNIIQAREFWFIAMYLSHVSVTVISATSRSYPSPLLVWLRVVFLWV